MSVEPKVAGQGMSSAPCFGQTHRIQSGEGVREDQHEVAQVVRTQESRAAPHHRSLQASKSPTLALIAAIKHRTDGGASSPRLWKFRPIHGSRIQGQAARVGERRGLQGLHVRAMGGGDEWSDEEGGDVPSTQAEEFGPAPEPSTSGRRNAVSRHEVGVPSTPPVAAFPGLVSLC